MKGKKSYSSSVYTYSVVIFFGFTSLYVMLNRLEVHTSSIIVNDHLYEEGREGRRREGSNDCLSNISQEPINFG